MLLRLDKILSMNGIASRSETKELIRKGQIIVDGMPAKRADEKLDTEKAKIEVAGRELLFREYCYIMMNKPAGVISATEDDREQTVVDLLSPELKRRNLFPAGRLDKDSEGLLILTDDGQFCHDIISPKKKVPKKYYVETASKIAQSDCIAFEKGIVLSDGTKCLPGNLEILGTRYAEVIIYEGKFHQVKRMFEALENRVIYLKRISVGNLILDEKLKPGEYRQLTDREIQNTF